MSANEKSISELIQELANDPAAELYARACEVLEVDESARTCDVRPYDGTADIYGVRLQAIEGSDQGAVFVPKKGSGVLVVFISKSRAFVASHEQLEKILIDCEVVTFNGGENGGTWISPKANIELNKLKARITALEALISAFASGQASVAGGIVVLAPLAPALSTLAAGIGTLPPSGTFDDGLIDDKITH